MTSKIAKRFEKFILFYNTLKGKIRTRLIISFVLIIVLSISIIGFITYYLSNNNMERTVIDSSKQATEQIVENLEFNFQHINTILLIPYYNPDFIDNIKDYGALDDVNRFVFNQRISDWFLRSLYLYTRKDLEGVCIFFQNGDLIYNSKDLQKSVTNGEIRNSVWFQAAIKADGRISYMGKSKSIFDSEKNVFSATRLVKKNEDKTYTIMLAEFNTKVFNDICSKAFPAGGGDIYITDENGYVVYSKDNSKSIIKLEDNILKKIKTEKNSFWYKYSNEEYLVTSASSTTNWKVISMVPKAKIFENPIKVRNITIFIAFLAILACTAISIMISTSISRPISYLLKTFDKVKHGEYDVRVKIIDENDEISRIGISFNTMLAKINELIKNKYINELKLRDAELDSLYSQINPHFLYNTLDCIKSMAECGEAGLIPDMINALSDMFKYNIKNKRSYVTIEDEINNIKRYLMIQMVRFSNKFSVQYNIEEKMLNRYMPKLLLQPIVENAIFHGIEKKKGTCLLKITGFSDDEDIYFEVFDDGVGISGEVLERIQIQLADSQKELSADSFERHIGILNVHSRLRLSFGDQYGVQISGGNNIGTLVKIKFPIMNNVGEK